MNCFNYTEGEGKVKNVMQIFQLFVLCEHRTEQALPAEKMDQKVQSDTWRWNPLERFSVETGRANVRFDFI